MQLLDLATEILLNIASHLPQSDLLNVTLTNRRLQQVTESELYREYANRHMYGRSFKPFVLRLIERPELAKYVRRVDLRAYKSLAELNPEYGPISSRFYLEDCTAEEYDKLTQAACELGVIDEAPPFEPTSSILRTMTSWEYQVQFNEEDALGWYDFLYDKEVSIDDVPFNTKFCKQLRIGLDEPLVILLLALLPNLCHLDLWGAPHHPQTLPWRVRHGFKALQHLTVAATDGELEWPLAFLNDVLKSSNTKTLEVLRAGDGWREDSNFDVDPVFTTVPLSLPPGCTSITRLVMQNCTLSRSQMGVLLQACPRLTSLCYSKGVEFDGLNTFSMVDLVELLSSHKTSLEELVLDVLLAVGFDEPSDELPSLRDFTSLKRLDITQDTWGDILLRPTDGGANAYEAWLIALENDEPLGEGTEKLCDKLPRSLQCFIFHATVEDRTSKWDYRHMEDLNRRRPTALPNLHQVIIVHSAAFETSHAYSRLCDLSSNLRSSQKFLDDSNAIHIDFRLDMMPSAMYGTLYRTVFTTEDNRLRVPRHCVTWKDEKYVLEERMPSLWPTGSALADQIYELGVEHNYDMWDDYDYDQDEVEV